MVGASVGPTEQTEQDIEMPVIKTATGYKWGTQGKVYPTRTQAEQQGRAIMAKKKKGGKRGGKRG